MRNPTIADNTIHDSDQGILIIGAHPVARGNSVSSNGTGIALRRFVTPALEANVIEANAVGLSLEDCRLVPVDGATPAWVVSGNTICGNEQNVVATRDLVPAACGQHHL